MTDIENTICVIPARRGSKRLKLKNILNINGKPILSYSIIAAKKSGIFKDVYVATEDEEIAKIAIRFGAKVPFLVPKRLCGDLVPSWEPCVFLADYLNKNKEAHFENLVCFQPNSVLLSSVDIQEAVRSFFKNKYDFLVSVTTLDPHFFHWAMKADHALKDWKLYFGNTFLKDRHFLPEVYRPNGAIKIARLTKLRKQKNFFGKKIGTIIMPEERSLAVVNKFDLMIAGFILKEGISSNKKD